MIKSIQIHSPVIAIAGPTAIGKTALSLDIARTFNCEIISVDSMQVYKYMDIGTAKITCDEMESVPHHLIDIVNPDDEYDAARFIKDASNSIIAIIERGKIPLLAGGTGLYLKALSEGLFSDIHVDLNIRNKLKVRIHEEGTAKLHKELFDCDPDSAKRIHKNDSSRIVRGLEIFLSNGKPWSVYISEQKLRGQEGVVTNILLLGLTTERTTLYNRINERTKTMIEQGLEEEVATLLSMGYGAELNSMRSIGYRHMLNYLDSTWSFSEMVELLQRDTRRYAKRQYTWFNKISGLEWFDVKEHQAITRRIDQWIQS